jgi:hypothetical protein
METEYRVQMSSSELARADLLDSRCTPEEWQRLTKSERVQLCRKRAEDAKSLSASADAVMNRVYLDLALHWMALANEIEQQSRGA